VANAAEAGDYGPLNAAKEVSLPRIAPLLTISIQLAPVLLLICVYTLLITFSAVAGM